jgi:hypothetical protein
MVSVTSSDPLPSQSQALRHSASSPKKRMLVIVVASLTSIFASPFALQRIQLGGGGGQEARFAM